MLHWWTKEQILNALAILTVIGLGLGTNGSAEYISV
jgi:hypothetical protein